jgi:hypothetical protein
MHPPKGGHWTMDTKNNYATVTFVYFFVETYLFVNVAFCFKKH